MFTQYYPTKRSGGFTLVELLVVIVIILILTAVLLPVLGLIRAKMRLSLAKNTMNSVKIAIDQYKADLGEYPPDDTPSKNGSELIWYYLCRKLQPTVTTPDGRTVQSESHFGPYLQVSEDQLMDAGNGSNKKFMSPLKNDYHYVVIVDSDKQRRNYLLVDPGPDKLLGGDMDSNKGFTPNGGDENKDGIPDDQDNIFSSTQASTK